MNRARYNDFLEQAHELMNRIKAKGEQEALAAFASVLQVELSMPRCNIYKAYALDYIMRGVSVALQDGKDADRRGYVLGNMRQGSDAYESGAE